MEHGPLDRAGQYAILDRILAEWTHRYELTMRTQDQDYSFGRSLSDDAVRALFELRNSSSDVVDAAIASGEVRERVLVLFDLNLRGRRSSGLSGVRAYSDVLETLAQEYPGCCPVFLLWRVWQEERSRSLASDVVRCPLLSYGSLSHQALVVRAVSCWKRRKRERFVRGAVLAEVR